MSQRWTDTIGLQLLSLNETDQAWSEVFLDPVNYKNIVGTCRCDSGNLDNTTRHKHGTALICVCHHGFPHIVKSLLETGTCDIHEHNSEGFTAIDIACINDRIECVKLLVEAGCIANMKKLENYTLCEEIKTLICPNGSRTKMAIKTPYKTTF